MPVIEKGFQYSLIIVFFYSIKLDKCLKIDQTKFFVNENLPMLAKQKPKARIKLESQEEHLLMDQMVHRLRVILLEEFAYQFNIFLLERKINNSFRPYFI